MGTEPGGHCHFNLCVHALACGSREEWWRLGDAARLAAMEVALLRVREAAAGNLVVVEGSRDVAALEALGVGGEHVCVNQGRSLADWCDRLAETAGQRRVLLLLDWDRTGRRLHQAIHRALAGRVAVDEDVGRRLGAATHATAVEDVPADLDGLRRRAPIP